MTNPEIIELIKTFIKSRTEQVGNNISLSYLDNLKQDSIQFLKQFIPSVSEKDSQTIEMLFQTARNEFLSINPVDINPSATLKKKDLKIWLTDERKQNLPNDYLNRYLTYLRKSGRSEKVIEEINRSSEKILGHLGDPKSDSEFWIKGLVVGSVQSGKTGNFNAVINRAIDAGYSLIIVLSGIMEDLRSQTQLRIEADVIGEGTINVQTDSKGDKGVGKVRKFGELGDQKVRQVFSITSYKSDFVRTVKESDFSLNNKNILICKKNTGVLKNLLIWLNDYLIENKDKHNIPFLIIDDEADNASLNNLGHLGSEYASTINGHIRALLNLFSKKTYLGYTATPFANVLQDRNEAAVGKWRISYKSNGQIINKEFDQVDNIFPDDFIELLNPPTNYIGAKQIFETVLDNEVKKIPLILPIEDCFAAFPIKVFENSDGSVRPATEEEIEARFGVRASKKNDPFPYDVIPVDNTYQNKLPDSLKEAIDCFILTIGLRLSRKPEMVNSALYNPHHTMLVHISRFITWQTKTKTLISRYITNLESKILNDLPSSPDSIYGELEKVWYKNYASIVSDIRTYLPEGYQDEFLISKTFNEIRPFLIEAIKGIETKAINSETKDKLIYSEDAARNGKKYIAIGGNRLSRGFTLEGLTINYFIRNTNFSDTLLQMGRWFGYRPGYLDCCKLFTTTDAIEKFDLTTRTIEELEMEFIKMERKNKTPEEFILRVRKHPGALKITRPSILKNTEEVNWSYQDKLEQTTSFDLNAEKIKRSWDDLRSLFSKYSTQIINNDKFYTIDTDYKGLFEFLSITNTFHDYEQELENIKRFLTLCVAKDKLKNWTIAIKKTGDAGELLPTQTNLPDKIQMAQRSGPEKDPSLRDKFLENKLFTASGKSANIVTSGSDFSLLLSEFEIKEAQKEFREERKKYFMEKDENLSEEEATKKASKLTFPERIYREKMSDKNGLMVIYLFDLKNVFRQDTETKDLEMENMIKNDGFDLKIPLFGYAIGFPPISPDPGGVYLKGKYDITEDEGDGDELDEELMKELSDIED